jgi:capsular polysaccharide biosynthesis protein
MLHNPLPNGRRQAAPVGTGLGSSTPALGAESENVVLSLRDFLAFLSRRLWVIVLVVILVTGATVGYSFTQTPMYEASITILVGQERGAVDNPPVDVGGLQKLTNTIAEGVNSVPVAEGVIRQLGLEMTPDELLSNLRVEPVGESQFVRATYSDPSPERAQQIATAIGDVSSEQFSEVSPSASAITATVWETPRVPNSAASPNPFRNGLLALGLGLMLAMMIAYLIEYLDNSWRTPEEVEEVSGLPNLGSIPEVKVSEGQKKVRY